MERLRIRKAIGFSAALLLSAETSFAEEKEPALVFEMGGGGEFGFRGGTSYGPEIGLEYTIIKRWLEVETSVNPLFRRGQAEIGTDFIFKKPFQITDRLEFLIGAGPEWIHRTNKEPDSVAGVAITELVYEILPERHVAVFVQPAYSYDFGKGHEQAISVTAGLHIGIE
jgi:hypothetical protein